MYSQLVIFVLCLCASFVQTSANCPDSCFCNELIATRICSRAGISSNCEVGRCVNGVCGSNVLNGWKCQEKALNQPLLLSKQAVQRIRTRIESAGGCNGNVCFAIDGSGSISRPSWTNELKFVADVVNLISASGRVVAAVQYSDKSYPISSLTTDYGSFTADVLGDTQVRKTTSISAGIRFCEKELRTVPGQANKVVVLGDGFQNVDRDAVPAANAIRSIHGPGTVCAVAAGNVNQPLLDSIAGNDPNMVFKVKNFNDVVALVSVIENLAYAICGI